MKKIVGMLLIILLTITGCSSTSKVDPMDIIKDGVRNNDGEPIAKLYTDGKMTNELEEFLRDEIISLNYDLRNMQYEEISESA